MNGIIGNKRLTVADLRHGNYVYDAEGEMVAVCNLSPLLVDVRQEDGHIRGLGYGDIEPIPLDGGMLRRMDFVLGSGGYYHYLLYPLLVSVEHERHAHFKERGGSLVVCCRYLHELQNAYWVVTGKELRLNTRNI